MKLFLVIGETRFYLPEFVADFLRRTKDDVIGAALVTKNSPKYDMTSYLLNHWYYLRPSEWLKLGMREATMMLKDRISKWRNNGSDYTVRGVFERFGIDYFDVEYDINRREYLDRIQAKEPDVIISSNPLIFKKELLNMPKICCLNRHSSLLPSYGGLWPVFHAFRAGEQYAGVSIHTMESKIDAGVVLAQRKTPIEPDDTVYGVYDRSFKLSGDALLEALNKIRVGDFSPAADSGVQPSYYLSPEKEHWQALRQRGARFI